MSSALILILVIAGAYLLAHVAFEWLADRYLVVSGAEYLLLGILLGPQLSGLISASVVDDFAPLMTLALGWIGILVGTEFYIPRLQRSPPIYYRIAFVEAMFSCLAVTGVMALAFFSIFRTSLRDAFVPAVALGAIGIASAPSGILLVGRRFGWRGPVMAQLAVASSVNGFVAIVMFAGLLCVTHLPPGGSWRPPTPTEWAVISVGIGLVGGALFHLFLGGERNFDRLVVALSGAVILASGAAAYLRLSPLLPSMLIGMILVNTSRNRDLLREALARVERPFYLVLLIFAGAAWRPGAEAWLVAVALFLVTRVATSIGSARLATRLNGMLPTLGGGWGRALLGQGELALAIGLNYRIHESALLPNLVFTATVASVLLTHVSSARLVQSVARSDGQLKVVTTGEYPANHGPAPSKP